MYVEGYYLPPPNEVMNADADGAIAETAAYAVDLLRETLGRRYEGLDIEALETVSRHTKDLQRQIHVVCSIAKDGVESAKVSIRIGETKGDYEQGLEFFPELALFGIDLSDVQPSSPESLLLPKALLIEQEEDA